MRSIQFTFMALTLLGLVVGARAQNQTQDIVAAEDNYFQTISNNIGEGTNSITIHQGETVEWVFVGQNAHTVTSSTLVNGVPLFDSGALGQGSTFSYQFLSTGTYPYVCRLHPQMIGTVIVVSPPSVGGRVPLAEAPVPAAGPSGLTGLIGLSRPNAWNTRNDPDALRPFDIRTHHGWTSHPSELTICRRSSHVRLFAHGNSGDVLEGDMPAAFFRRDRLGLDALH